jgi:hypothetical protein
MPACGSLALARTRRRRRGETGPVRAASPVVQVDPNPRPIVGAPVPASRAGEARDYDRGMTSDPFDFEKFAKTWSFVPSIPSVVNWDKALQGIDFSIPSSFTDVASSISLMKPFGSLPNIPSVGIAITDLGLPTEPTFFSSLKDIFPSGATLPPFSWPVQGYSTNYEWHPNLPEALATYEPEPMAAPPATGEVLGVVAFTPLLFVNVFGTLVAAGLSPGMAALLALAISIIAFGAITDGDLYACIERLYQWMIRDH